jgi:hypothetical protein
MIQVRDGDAVHAIEDVGAADHMDALEQLPAPR